MKALLRNKVVWYTFSRYFTYGIQFVGSLLIAKFLGAYYLGIWGFVLLVLQYLARINFGISNATNAIASVHKSEEKYVEQVVGVGMSLLLLLSCLIVVFFAVQSFLGVELGAKYSFVNYIPYVVGIAIFTHFNLFFANIFRVYGKLFAIAVSQSLIPVSLLLVTFFYRGEELLLALVIANFIAVILSFLLFVFTSPVSCKPLFKWDLARLIQLKGFYLFVYNASFYLIIISTRSFISDNYSVREFGYFTFAYTLANAILLLFQSMSFLIFPKLLNRLSQNTNEEAYVLLKRLRDSYVTICHFSMHLAILCYPLLMLFLPEYRLTGKVFCIIGLTVLIYTNAFGYQGLIIARAKEKSIAFIAFVALLLNIVLNAILIMVFHISFEFVMFATMLTYFVYVFVLTRVGERVIEQKRTFVATFLDVFNFRWMLPFLLSIVVTIYLYDINWLYSLPLFIFVILNYKALLTTYNMGKNILVNPNIIDI